MKLTITLKLSIGAVLLVMASATIVGSLFYSKTTELLVTRAEEDIAVGIRDAGDVLQERVNTQRNDTVFLSVMPPIQGLLRAAEKDDYDELDKSTYKQWEQRLQSVFSSMLENKPDYTQIRLIDKSGQELVVVNRVEGKSVILEKNQLQDKSHRTYVDKTLKLSQASVYLSEINLNREHGEISKPHREVLRSATPIYETKTNKATGLIIITSEIGHLFRELQSRFSSEGSQIYVTNDRGGYLLHPDVNKKYGFDLGKRYRIQEDIPQLATLYLPDNLDSHSILLPKDTDGKQVINFTKISFDPDRPRRFIAVGIAELYHNIVAKQAGVLNEVLFAAIVMVVGVMLLAILFSYRLARPIKQITQVMDDYSHQRATTTAMPIHLQDEIGVLARSYLTMINQIDDSQIRLLEMNRDLESMVNERTKNLEASEMRQRSIVETMADGLITINATGLIASFNPSAETIFGYRAEEVIDKNINMLMPEPYHSRHDGYLKDYQNTGKNNFIGSIREVTGLKKDGNIFPMELGLSEITNNGQALYSGLVRDISERKQIEKMKNEFISTVSHELRTPLTAIRGSLGLINGGVMGDVPEKASSLLKVAGNNVERLLLLINDILDLQKIESGQMDFKFQYFDVKTFLEQTIQDNHAYGDQYNVKFVIGGALPNVQLFADHDRLCQVMANLLSNAAKFSPVGGEVEIRAEEQAEGSMRISVIDHGSGIPKAFQPKLFDKFTQSDSSDTRQKGGTGLGLSISKLIVEKHGGLIDFISQEGKGATFFFDLPKKKSVSL